MSLPPRPPFPSLIPESAPFTAEQRVWLDGLFAGLLSLEHGVTPLSREQAEALLPGGLDLSAPSAATTEDDDDAPWHDPAMPLGERMKLAESRPLRRRMMAAMGQQDCGQCGYSCQDYSDAIFSEKEKRLNLCVPGGKETNRMLKALHQELGQTPAASKTAEIPPETPPPADATGAPATAPGCSREYPAQAVFLARTTVMPRPARERERKPPPRLPASAARTRRRARGPSPRSVRRGGPGPDGLNGRQPPALRHRRGAAHRPRRRRAGAARQLGAAGP